MVLNFESLFVIKSDQNITIRFSHVCPKTVRNGPEYDGDYDEVHFGLKSSIMTLCWSCKLGISTNPSPETYTFTYIRTPKGAPQSLPADPN